MNKCLGCGAIMQMTDKDKEGYTNSFGNSLCERCFRIKNYSDYKIITKNNEDFEAILYNVGKTNSLVLLVVDLFNIPKNLDDLSKYFHNDILLVLTKRDVLPLSVYDVNLVNYFNRYKLNIVDTIIISSKRNYQFDLLLDKIKYYQKDKNVYAVGFTNAGKSTMINKILYNYTDKNPVITTSMIPSTTIDSLNIEIDNHLTLIDTPGLLDEGSMINLLDSSTLKRIIPNKEIKPKTYQIKTAQVLNIEDLLQVACENDNSLTFYIANDLEITRDFKNKINNNLVKHHLQVKAHNDIVINGLGFIKVVKEDELDIYTLDGVGVYVRDALI